MADEVGLVASLIIQTKVTLETLPEFQTLFDRSLCDPLYGYLHWNIVYFSGRLSIRKLVQDIETTIKLLNEKGIHWWSEPVCIMGEGESSGILSIHKNFLSILYVDKDGCPEQKIWKFPSLQEKL